MATGRGTMKGRFIPKNPGKYLGNPDKIIGRSSWEFRFFKWCDSTPSVLQWGSEEFSIPYLHPIEKRVAQYYPDAIVVYKDKFGNVKKEIIEIKPYKETVLTPKSTDRDKYALAVNHAKWKAASDFATQQGLTFRILTERSMFANGKSK